MRVYLGLGRSQGKCQESREVKKQDEGWNRETLCLVCLD